MLVMRGCRMNTILQGMLQGPYHPCLQSPKSVGEDLCKATKEWKGMNVTCKLIVVNRKVHAYCSHLSFGHSECVILLFAFATLYRDICCCTMLLLVAACGGFRVLLFRSLSRLFPLPLR